MDPSLDHGSHLPGGTHRQASLREELAGDDLDLTPKRDEIEMLAAAMNESLLERSELATVVLPRAFPASSAALVATARDQGAPPEIVEQLEQLPPATYDTVQEVWVALGGPTQTRVLLGGGVLLVTAAARRLQPRRSANPSG
jgi:hypothetical protein